jgi:putative phage-type endonuclease
MNERPPDYFQRREHPSNPRRSKNHDETCYEAATMIDRSSIKKIGGSDISALLGLSRWKSAHSLYLHLIGELPPTKDNPAMERGRKLEPVVASIFQANHEEYCVFEHGIVTHREHDFLIGSPDFLLSDMDSNYGTDYTPVSGLEIKTADISKANEWGEEGTDEIPVEYLIQCQWYAGLLGVPDWHLAVGFVKPGSKKIVGYREYYIKSDPARYEAMKQMAVDFWNNHVVPQIAPEIVTADAATVEYYRKKERSKDAMIYSDEALDEKINSLRVRQAQRKEAERMEELEKTQLIAMLGSAEGIIDRFTGKNALTFKEQSTTSFDHKALCADLEISDEVQEKYRRKTPFRVLRLAK